MASAREHFEQAENLLDESTDFDGTDPDMVARAQVHALLALAAVTAGDTGIHE